MTHPLARQQEIEREARRRQVAAILLSGIRDQTIIASQLHVDRSTISRDIKYIEGEWRAATISDVNEAKTIDLLRIDRMIASAWTAATKGDTRAIGEIRQLIKLRADIIGYAAPAKFEGTVNVKLMAEQVAAELGLDPGDVIAEAERIIAGSV